MEPTMTRKEIEKETKLLDALQDCVSELERFKDDVYCDHEVGVCNCSFFAALDNAKAVLAEHADQKA
jgi:hypothetical protein